jgi:endonuclease-3 related protein
LSAIIDYFLIYAPSSPEDLLAIKGIGSETVDTVWLYTLDRPVFIINEYTRRFVAKHRLTSVSAYHELQSYCENNLNKDVSLYQNFHALIIISQRGSSRSGMEII